MLFLDLGATAPATTPRDGDGKAADDDDDDPLASLQMKTVFNQERTRRQQVKCQAGSNDRPTETYVRM